MNKRNLSTVLKTFAMILLFTLIADKCIFYAFNTISDRVLTGQSIGKLNHYLKIKDKLDLIVYGSSRANHSVDPDMLSDNGFNIGLDGRKLAYSETLIKLLPKKSNQFILLHIDPENAFDPSYTGRDIKALGSKYNRIEAVKNEMNRLHQDNVLQIFFWSLSYNGIILGILKNYLAPKYNYRTFNGYEPLKVSPVQKEIRKTVFEKDFPEICKENLILNQHYAVLLNELKKFCKENNKRIIIFTSPKYKDSCKKDNLEFRKLMEEKNFTYYDLTDYFASDNKIEYWKDKIHLSNIGAKLFTHGLKVILHPHLHGV